MKFTCTQENLVRGLSQVVPVAGRNSQLPILQNILLQVENGVLTLTATDLEIGIRTSVGGKGEEEGVWAVPARRLFEYVQQLPSGKQVVLHVKGEGGMKVQTQGYRASFPVVSGEDFPLLPEGNRESSVTVPTEQFTTGLAGVLFSAARDTTRPEIRSVYVVSNDDGIRVVATDSFRLAEARIDYKGDEELSLLVPLSSAQEIVRVFADHEDPITLSIHESHVVVYGSETELSSRLVEGKYPDYQQIIPSSFTGQATFSRTEMIRALKTLLVFLPRESRRVGLDIAPGSKKMIAHVAGSESGQGDVEIAIEGSGNDVQIVVNIQYLLEGLQHIAGDKVEMSFSGPHDPVVVRPTVKGSYVYVVMPIQAT